MKKILLIFILISYMSCDEDGTYEKNIFNSSDLSKLSLDKINSFWDGDSVEYDSDFIGIAFNTHNEFIDGIRYRSEKKVVAVSVFKSQTGAIEAMELRIDNVASVIIVGEDHELISSQWWYTESIPNTVFVNQWNTIIEASYYHPEYNEVAKVLMETANDIALTVDSLSN